MCNIVLQLRFIIEQKNKFVNNLSKFFQEFVEILCGRAGAPVHRGAFALRLPIVILRETKDLQ